MSAERGLALGRGRSGRARARSGGPYWESLVASTRAHIWAENTRALPNVAARLGPEAARIGAEVRAVTAQQAR